MTPTAQALAEVVALVEKELTWQCDGDDGNGCECDLRGHSRPNIEEAAVNFIRTHGPALLAQLGGGREVVWPGEAKPAADGDGWVATIGDFIEHRMSKDQARVWNGCRTSCINAHKRATPTEPAQAGRDGGGE